VAELLWGKVTLGLSYKRKVVQTTKWSKLLAYSSVMELIFTKASTNHPTHVKGISY
jgi:hypothetical protein